MEENYTSGTAAFLFRLICRFSLFLSLLLFVLVLFYISGNFQQFLDSTQIFTILSCTLVSVMLFFFSIAGFFDNIVMLILSHRKRHLLYALVFILLTACSAVAFIVLRSLSFLSSGLH
jgi:hypothetical protein